ncbi:hypothetical protein JTB14_014772 [Gonioctena quinquepunctata]|nr:hypothetical protein JTB14_014772 [Gonioctena quinquepunctata]
MLDELYDTMIRYVLLMHTGITDYWQAGTQGVDSGDAEGPQLETRTVARRRLSGEQASRHSRISDKMQKLLPHNLSDEDIEDVSQGAEVYKEDLPCFLALKENYKFGNR